MATFDGEDVEEVVARDEGVDVVAELGAAAATMAVDRTTSTARPAANPAKGFR